MLRLGHRLSKDIDLFVPHPQYLGYVNPRLSDVAEEVSSDYEENAEFLEAEFNAIDNLSFKMTFGECVKLARHIVLPQA
jgi:hypothetical protein